jgi:CRISPR-associated protein Csd1
MSVLSALYHTYNNALKNDMVGRTELLNQQTVLLPVYHSNKKSTGAYDIIEVTLSEKGNFIKAEWLLKDQVIIFPITENSIIRAGSVISPHPLCDELSYIAKEYDLVKHNEYNNGLKDWVNYAQKNNYNRLLDIVSSYIFKETIFQDCVSLLFSGSNYQINEDYSITLNPGEKSEKKVELNKTFVTFQVETDSSIEPNLTVSTNREIHLNYINYVREGNKQKPQVKCDISNEETYCISRHRGLLGNAKLISISNHDETYYGRFSNGEEIIHIGYEVSQKIHLMTKYLIENSQNQKKIGISSYLINWFSDDIENIEAVNLTSAISPYDDMDEEDMDDDLAQRTLGGGVSSAINDYITGNKRDVDPEGKFYLMILDKISNGRISVKYFKELPRSDLFERVEYWYLTTSWQFYNGKTKRVSHKTPSLFYFANAIYGNENSQGFLDLCY